MYGTWWNDMVRKNTKWMGQEKQVLTSVVHVVYVLTSLRAFQFASMNWCLLQERIICCDLTKIVFDLLSALEYVTLWKPEIAFKHNIAGQTSYHPHTSLIYLRHQNAWFTLLRKQYYSWNNEKVHSNIVTTNYFV